MGGTCATDATNSEIAKAVLTIPQTITTNNLTGTITYEYHTHTDSCYEKCGRTIWFDKTYDASNNQCYKLQIHCSYPNFAHDGSAGFDKSDKRDEFIAQYPKTCQHDVLICGYSQGQLIGATITY